MSQNVNVVTGRIPVEKASGEVAYVRPVKPKPELPASEAQIAGWEDGVDPRSAVGLGIGSFAEIYKEPSIYDGMTPEEEEAFIRHAETGE